MTMLPNKITSLFKVRQSFIPFIHIVRTIWIIDKSNIPTLKEKDLEEKFISGSGPGGQSVNKSINCCMLKHIPTGLIVKCHQERSLEFNRKKARQLMTTKLDNLLNGEQSIEAQMKRQLQKKENIAKKKQEKLRMLKKEWKERQKQTEELNTLKERPIDEDR